MTHSWASIFGSEAWISVCGFPPWKWGGNHEPGMWDERFESDKGQRTSQGRCVREQGSDPPGRVQLPGAQPLL